MIRKVLIPALLVLAVHGKGSKSRKQKDHRRSVQAKRRMAERALFTEDQDDLPPRSPSVESARHSDRPLFYQQIRSTVAAEVIKEHAEDVEEAAKEPVEKTRSDPPGETAMEQTQEGGGMTVWVRSFGTSSMSAHNVPASATIDDLKQKHFGEGAVAERFDLSQDDEGTPLDGGQSLADLGVCAESVLGVVPRHPDVTQLRQDIRDWVPHLQGREQEIVDKAVAVLGAIRGRAILLIRVSPLPGVCIRKDDSGKYEGISYSFSEDRDTCADMCNMIFLGHFISARGPRPENFKEISM